MLRWCAILVMVSAAHAAVEVRLLEPSSRTMLAWGRTRPALTVKATLLRDGQRTAPARSYLTAIVWWDESGDRVADRVSLFDDGTHGDTQAGDGIYQNDYSPPAAQRFRLAVQARWDEPRGGGAVEMERRGEPVTLDVVRVPEPVIVEPRVGGNLGVDAEARLRLEQDKRIYEQPEPDAAVTIWARCGDQTLGPLKAEQRGHDWVAPLHFPHLGEWEIGGGLTCRRSGQPVTIEADSVKANVARAPRAGLLLAALLALAWFISIRAPHYTVYRYSVRGTDADEVAFRLEDTFETLGQPDHLELSSAHVPGLGAARLKLIARRRRKAFEAEVTGGSMVIGGHSEAAASIDPDTEFTVGAVRLRVGAKAGGQRWCSFGKLSAGEKATQVLLFVAMLASGYLGWAAYARFQSQ